MEPVSTSLNTAAPTLIPTLTISTFSSITKNTTRSKGIAIYPPSAKDLTMSIIALTIWIPIALLALLVRYYIISYTHQQRIKKLGLAAVQEEEKRKQQTRTFILPDWQGWGWASRGRPSRMERRGEVWVGGRTVGTEEEEGVEMVDMSTNDSEECMYDGQPVYQRGGIVEDDDDDESASTQRSGRKRSVECWKDWVVAASPTISWRESWRPKALNRGL